MNKWKIIIGLLVVMVVAVEAVGGVSAQTTVPTPSATPSQNIGGWMGYCYRLITGAANTNVQTQSPNAPVNPAQNMWAWMQNCYRWMTGNTGTGVQTQNPSSPSNPTTTAPSAPNQAYYRNGPCWVR